MWKSSKYKIITTTNVQLCRHTTQQISSSLTGTRMKLSRPSSSLSSAVITVIELPWWQVLIDGPIIHYWETAALALALTGILLDNCHRGTQSSCNLTAEVSHKHIITHAQNRLHTRACTQEQRQACTDLHGHTHRLSTLILMGTRIAYKTYTLRATNVHSHMHMLTQSVSMTCDWHVLTV